MRYKVVAITTDPKVAQLLWELINKSAVYNNPDYIINLSLPKEVCDECARNG